MISHFSLIEKILLNRNIIPHPILDAMVNVVAGRTLQVAIKVGILKAVEREVTFEEIKQATQLSREGLSVILESLIALKYVEKKNQYYCLSKRGKKFFSENAETPMHNMVLFTNHHFSLLQNLEENVRRGGQIINPLESFDSQEKWDIFTGAMLELAYEQAPEAARLISHKQPKKLLDLGGSHGFYAVEFCKKFPNMSATVLDLEPTRKYAENTIRKNNMIDRIKFRSADFLKEDIGKDFDIILAANVVHTLNFEENQSLAKKIFDALNPNGLYFILDQIEGGPHRTDLSHLIASSISVMLFNVAGGKTYSRAEVEGWLVEKGFADISFKKMRTPGFVACLAKKVT